MVIHYSISADNINFQQSVNTVVTGNINVANQINVMNVMGRRRRSSADRPRLDKARAGRIAKLGLEALLTMEGLVEDRVFIDHLNMRLAQSASSVELSK